MKKWIFTAGAFIVFLFIFSETVTGQASNQDEIIWTDEDFDNVEKENEAFIDTSSISEDSNISRVEQSPDVLDEEDEDALFDEEEKKGIGGLLRFLETSDKTDSLAALIKRLDTLDYIPFGETVTFKDTIIVNPIFMPFVFDGQVLYDNYKLYTPEWAPKDSLRYYHPIKEDSIFIINRQEQKLYRDLQNYIAKEYPTIIKYSKKNLPTDIPKQKRIKSTSSFAELIKVEDTSAPSDISGPNKYTPKVKKFVFTASNSLQFAQNYISPNWSAGGNSNLNLIAVNTFEFNYDNKSNFKINNKLESRLSLNNGPTDTLRSIRIGEDLLRLTSQFGLKATSKWDYTLNGVFETQLFKNYEANTNNLNAAFLSPFSINAGLGMAYSTTKEFKDNKYKKIVFSTNIAPISINYKYTKDTNIDVTRYGIAEGKRSFIDVGSTLNASVTFNFTRFISWGSNFKFFTNYKNIDSYWENTFDFAINRYFSTRIYVNVKYDDKVEKREDFDTYFQINELLSFGFQYKW